MVLKALTSKNSKSSSPPAIPPAANVAKSLARTRGSRWLGRRGRFVWPAAIWIIWCFSRPATPLLPAGRKNIRSCQPSWPNGAGRESATNGRGFWSRRRAWKQPSGNVCRMPQVRERRNYRAAAVRDESDREYIEQFAARVRELFPRCPAGREIEIAEHACQKYSGRVGRSASAKAFDENAIGSA